jgi:ABC-2 type transport system permease protein
MVRHALYGSFEPISTSVALATTLAFFVLAVLAYDPGHGTMARRGGPKGEAR